MSTAQEIDLDSGDYISFETGLPDRTLGLHVIDADTHWQEPPDLWTSRAPAKYRDKMPYVKRLKASELESNWAQRFQGRGSPNPDSYLNHPLDVPSDPNSYVDRWYVGDKMLGMMILWIDKDGNKNLRNEVIQSLDQADPGSYDVKSRLKVMDRMGVWAQIMFPNVTGFSAINAMNAFDDPELRTIMYRIYNDAISEASTESGGRLFGMAMLPVWDKDEMVREAHRATEELGLRGFVIGDRPELIGLPDYRDPHWEPLWDFCNQTGTPLCFHLGHSSNNKGVDMPWDSHMSGPANVVMTSLMMMGMGACMANFLLSGLFDRYPNLKLVSVESGVGWIPYLLEQMDYQVTQTVTRRERLSSGSRLPRDYFRDHFYGMFWSERLALRKEVIDFLGVKNLMFETDYPHYTCLYPDPIGRMNDVMRDLDDYTCRRLLQDNAAELFTLPVPVHN